MIGDDRPRTSAERAYAEAMACKDMLTPVPEQPSVWRRLGTWLAATTRTVTHRSTSRPTEAASPPTSHLPAGFTFEAGDGERR